MRIPSIRKKIAASISIKRQIVQRVGLKMPRRYGWARKPKKFVYNKIYNRTSFDVFKLFNKLFK